MFTNMPKNLKFFERSRREVSKFHPRLMCLSETQAKKRQREEDLSVSAVQKPLILLMVFVLVLKINAIIQTILRITDNGVSIGTKIKKMVLTHLGSGAISRIPAVHKEISKF